MENMLWGREVGASPFVCTCTSDACCRDSRQAGAHEENWEVKMSCGGDSLQGSAHNATLKIKDILSLFHDTRI